MRLLLVSATSTVPDGPRQRPPGSDSCADGAAPVRQPGLAAAGQRPDSVSLLGIQHLHHRRHSETRDHVHPTLLQICTAVGFQHLHHRRDSETSMCIQARSGFMQLCLETRVCSLCFLQLACTLVEVGDS